MSRKLRPSVAARDAELDQIGRIWARVHPGFELPELPSSVSSLEEPAAPAPASKKKPSLAEKVRSSAPPPLTRLSKALKSKEASVEPRKAAKVTVMPELGKDLAWMLFTGPFGPYFRQRWAKRKRRKKKERQAKVVQTKKKKPKVPVAPLGKAVTAKKEASMKATVKFREGIDLFMKKAAMPAELQSGFRDIVVKIAETTDLLEKEALSDDAKQRLLSALLVGGGGAAAGGLLGGAMGGGTGILPGAGAGGLGGAGIGALLGGEGLSGLSGLLGGGGDDAEGPLSALIAQVLAKFQGGGQQLPEGGGAEEDISPRPAGY